MAALNEYKKNHYRISLYDSQGKKKSIGLSQMKKSEAERQLEIIQELEDYSKDKSGMLSRGTKAFLKSCGDIFYDKLANAGLVEPKQEKKDTTLLSLIDRFIQLKKPTTPKPAPLP